MLEKQPYEDEAILDLIFTGQSEQGFKILVETYQEKLYWHIRRMVSIHDDANDVLQNTFIKVYKHIFSFKRESKLYTWLYRIATNESINFINKSKRSLRETDSDGLVNLENRLRADSYFDENSAFIELQKAISLLPEKQKAVFSMRYYDEMSYKDMSEIMETSVGALKASYHHAVKKIESYLKDKISYVE